MNKVDEQKPKSNTDDEDSRRYYIEYFGFDPIQDKVTLPNGYKYERFYTLENDPELMHAGVSIGARVEVVERGPKPSINNRIVFRRGDSEGIVSCVHTVLGTLPVEKVMESDEVQILQQVWGNTSSTINLPATEHFVALKSFIEGIIPLGIGNLLQSACSPHNYPVHDFPFGFNSAMQHQMIQAIRIVATPAAQAIVRDFIIALADSAPKDWFEQRFFVLDNIYHLRNVIFTDPMVFEAMDSTPHSAYIRMLAVHYARTHPAIVEILKADPRYAEYRKVKFQWFLPLLYKFKIAVVGGTDDSRNSICANFFTGHFRDGYLSTIGVSFGRRDVPLEHGGSIIFQFWNISSSDDVRQIIPNYFRGAHGVLIFYDVTDKTTFEAIPEWIRRCRQTTQHNVQLFLVGYNYDRPKREHQVDRTTVRRCAREWGCHTNITFFPNPSFDTERLMLEIGDALVQNDLERFNI